VTELGAERCPDRKDEDFVLLQALDPSGPAVVWVRIGNAVSRVLLERFTVAWPAILAALERGERVVEIR
jgi:predicted nuclease of predicted toxin-antitoxin system